MDWCILSTNIFISINYARHWVGYRDIWGKCPLPTRNSESRGRDQWTNQNHDRLGGPGHRNIVEKALNSACSVWEDFREGTVIVEQRPAAPGKQHCRQEGAQVQRPRGGIEHGVCVCACACVTQRAREWERGRQGKGDRMGKGPLWSLHPQTGSLWGSQTPQALGRWGGEKRLFSPSPTFLWSSLSISSRPPLHYPHGASSSLWTIVELPGPRSLYPVRTSLSVFYLFS